MAVIEVRKALFGSEVVAVLWPRRIAADFRLVINGFTKGVGTQKVKAMAGTLLCLQLKRVVGRVAPIRNGSEGPQKRVRPQILVETGAWRRDLVSVCQHLEMGSLRANVSR